MSSQKQPRGSKRKRREISELIHPYILKLDSRQEKILKMLNRLYELADNDLVICDRRTGLNDYTMNKKFADKLDNLAKFLLSMSTKCCQKATELRNKISAAEDKKIRKMRKSSILRRFLRQRINATWCKIGNCYIPVDSKLILIAYPHPHLQREFLCSRFQPMRKTKKSMLVMLIPSSCTPGRTLLNRIVTSVRTVTNISGIHKNFGTTVPTMQGSCTDA